MSIADIPVNRVQLKDWAQAVNGAACMAVGLVPTHPLFTLKTNLMLGIPQRSWKDYINSCQSSPKSKPSLGGFVKSEWLTHKMHARARGQSAGIALTGRLWAGYTPNAASGGPSEAIAFGTHAIITRFVAEKLFLNREQTENSNLDMRLSLIISVVAGSLGSPINASLEQGMIRQQVDGGKFWPHMRRIHATSGWRGVFKGTGATAGRDALFNCGVFTFNDFAKTCVTPLFPHNPLTRDLVSGMLAGMVAGALSTPCDLGKTLMQEDKVGKYPTFRATMRSIVKEEGFRGPFKGMLARAMTIGPLICATAVLKERHNLWCPEWFYESPGKGIPPEASKKTAASIKPEAPIKVEAPIKAEAPAEAKTPTPYKVGPPWMPR